MTMQAIGYREPGAPAVLTAFETEIPTPGTHDLLVEVRGVSVNPVDVKLRAAVRPEAQRILGFDAAGVVQGVGSEVSRFAVGDAVYYAGDITRPGSNAALQLVDERIAAPKPESLDFVDAAGMPLTTITAWELLFDRLGVARGGGSEDALLVIGGAGGVGSILIQLARQLTDLRVIATASRDDTRSWVREMGAHDVVNHRNPLDQELSALNVMPRYVAALTHTDRHFDAIVKLIAPQGTIALIDDPQTLDIVPLKSKAVSVAWEFMFTRSMYQTPDLLAQHELLREAGQLLDAGTLRSTVQQRAGDLTVENLRSAHERQESGAAIGKTVLRGLGG